LEKEAIIGVKNTWAKEATIWELEKDIWMREVMEKEDIWEESIWMREVTAREVSAKEAIWEKEVTAREVTAKEAIWEM